MEPRIELLTPKFLVGQRAQTSWADDQTSPLWRGFRAVRAEVPNRVDTRSWSVQRYGAAMAAGTFGPTTVFEKWAAVEVADFSVVPAGLETYELAGGLYAVFPHHGPASAYPQTARLIFGEWLPASPYRLDDRDHFEVFADSYWPFDPDATEEIWVPILAKNYLLSVLDEQQRICSRFAAEYLEALPTHKVGLAISTLGQFPLNALRHPINDDTSGWYIWAGEILPSQDDAFQPVHVAHLADICREILPYLGLAPGWRVLLAPDYVDVWFDPQLLIL